METWIESNDEEMKDETYPDIIPITCSFESINLLETMSTPGKVVDDLQDCSLVFSFEVPSHEIDVI